MTKWWPKGVRFCVFSLVFLVFLGGGGVSTFGHFRALETPGGDLGFQGSILEPKSTRTATLGVPFLDGFWILLGSVCEVLFGRPLDHVFDDFGMILGSFGGVVFVTFWTQKGGLHELMNNSICVAIYCTSGMSRIPTTTLFLNMFTFFRLLFVKSLFWDPDFSDFCEL